MAYDFEEASGQRITYSPNTASYTSQVAGSFWVKAESLPGSHQMHFCELGSASDYYPRNFAPFWTPNSGGEVGLSWTDGGSNFHEWSAAYTLPTGSWCHWYWEIDWTTNPDTALLWINGSSVSLTNTFGSNNVSPSGTYGQLCLGAEHGSTDNNNNLDGLLAEVALWSSLGGSTRASGLWNSGGGGRADILYPTNLTEYIRLKDDTTNSIGGSGTLSTSAPTLSVDHPFSDGVSSRRLILVS